MKKLLGIIVLGLLLQGCAGVEPLHVKYYRLRDAVSNYHNIAPSINLGDSQSVVLSKLQPLHSGMSSDRLKQPMQFSRDGKYFYVHFQRSGIIEDGGTTDDEFTPYIFANNTLIEIGWVTLQPNTFGQSGQSYSGADATTDILRGLLELEQKRNGTYNSGSSSSSSSSSSFKRQEVNGQTKICYYQTLGGVKAYNTTATTLCPMSYPY